MSASAAGRARRIILHPGAPKTGTTSLQHFFYDHEAALRNAGTVVPKRLFRKGDVDALHTDILAMMGGNDYAQALAAARARLDAVFARPGVHTVLISNEDLLGTPIAPRARGFFPVAAKRVARLGQLFEGMEVEVRYFVRDYAGFLAGCYVQNLRRGRSETLESYLAGLDFSELDWGYPVGLLRDAFGNERVAVFEHAALESRPAATVHAAFGALTGSLPDFPAQVYHRNRSVSARSAGTMRRMNGLLERLPARMRARVQKALRRSAFDLMAIHDWRLDRPKLSLPDDTATALQQKYAQDLARLM